MLSLTTALNTKFVLPTKISSVCLMLLCGFMLASCASSPDTETNTDTKTNTELANVFKQIGEIEIRGDSIIYNGYINEVNNNRLFELFEQAKISPVTLTVTSSGGSVSAGLGLGEWIYENQLEVNIPKMCGSSCANYVFTAGRQVTLGEEAVVFWHGSPVMDDLVAGTPQAKERWEGVKNSLEQTHPEVTNPRAFWNKIRIRNRKFFRTIGVHPVITILTSVADESSLSKIVEIGSWKSYGAYISVEDMKYFGIDNVRVEGDKAWLPDPENPLGDGLIRVSLVDDVEQRLADLKNYLNQID